MATKSEHWDIMLSYNWETGKECADALHKVLTESGYNIWIDEKCIIGDLECEMAKAVANSDIILLLISEKYEKSYNCIKEYTHASTCRKTIIPIQVENYLPLATSKLAFIISGKIYYKFYEEKEKNLKKIIKAIENEIGKRKSRPKNYLEDKCNQHASKVEKDKETLQDGYEKALQYLRKYTRDLNEYQQNLLSVKEDLQAQMPLQYLQKNIQKIYEENQKDLVTWEKDINEFKNTYLYGLNDQSIFQDVNKKMETLKNVLKERTKTLKYYLTYLNQAHVEHQKKEKVKHELILKALENKITVKVEKAQKEAEEPQKAQKEALLYQKVEKQKPAPEQPCIFSKFLSWISNSFIKPIFHIIFVRWVPSCFLYSVLFNQLIYDEFLMPTFDFLSKYEHDFQKNALLQDLHEALFLPDAKHRLLGIYGLFILPILVSAGVFHSYLPKDYNTGTATSAWVKWRSKTAKVAKFIIKYFGFLVIIEFVTEKRTTSLGDGALKPSKSVSILLISTTTVVSFYHKKHLPRLLQLVKELCGYADGNLFDQFFRFAIFGHLFFSFYIIIVNVFFEFMSSETYFSKVILSFFFFLVYQYAPVLYKNIIKTVLKSTNK